ncbi:hypothetical protein P280DRAFT_490728 [Massarina eburnea CBS 473.64]|uniref:Uncharacterized protein n=1 Tax=Massarina eburnea CBS 473.64 TaxID=1395130 RepID=A0A6A6RVR0_9PLEO|nr:hypothetical protein P280DRAFT_490728 [Massarina eburnea CBS 473.64]
MSARDTWEALCKYYIVHDPGTNFASKEFCNYAKIAVSKIKRAHAPLCQTYNILKVKIGYFKALNDTASLNSLVPTLLVFSAYLRINTDLPPSPDIVARATVIKKVIKMLAHNRAKVDISCALETRNGLATYDILNAPLGSPSIEGTDVIVKADNGPIKIRCSHVKSYNPLLEDKTKDRTIEHIVPKDILAPILLAPAKRPRGRLRKNPLPTKLTPVRQTRRSKV